MNPQKCLVFKSIQASLSSLHVYSVIVSKSMHASNVISGSENLCIESLLAFSFSISSFSTFTGHLGTLVVRNFPCSSIVVEYLEAFSWFVKTFDEFRIKSFWE